MAALTNYTENQIINHIFRTTAFTRPATLYVGLILSGTDFEAGTVTEVSAAGYARVVRNPLDANWAASSIYGTTSNVLTIQFPAATADWGTVTSWGIWDAATGGNLLIYASLNTPRTITNGVNSSFAPGFLTFQIDSN